MRILDEALREQFSRENAAGEPNITNSGSCSGKLPGRRNALKGLVL